MTKLNTIAEGGNKFCGPAILAVLTGKSTDECAAEVSKVTGSYKVKGVYTKDMLKVLGNLGFTYKQVQPARSLFATLTMLSNDDGLYIVVVKTGPKDSHYVAIEISGKQVFFCDNHTMEPINAQSSSRLSLTVLEIYKVFPKPVIQEVIRKEIIETKTIKLNMADICRLINVNPIDTIIRLSFDGSNALEADDSLIIETKTKRYE